ncbi:hypothetical protein PIB30_025928 [Stylosanthes scabra]|uniref:Peptidase C1A papain C-terminal domain-containing protein n=1 Tax=Stylosanthes scabra TaxID=79078 RepID=A0ABU6QA37_9FABA|nr:hypothetical protein [Stylosanthes scabra]
MVPAFQFIINQSGLPTEKDYPYAGIDRICNKAKTISKYIVNISGYENVPARNESLLRVAVAHQPVSVSIDATGYAFQLYSHGIFSGVCGKSQNHAVTIVGYGEEKGIKYWLVKNSWGSKWGESGYMRLMRENMDPDGTCGIAMDASYPVITNTSIIVA